jgi:hypothetical protein
VRRKIALGIAGVAVAASLAPLTSASANCDPDTGLGDGGCTNGCMSTGAAYENLRAHVGDKAPLPSYWDLVNCPQ